MSKKWVPLVARNNFNTIKKENIKQGGGPIAFGFFQGESFQVLATYLLQEVKQLFPEEATQKTVSE